MAKQELKQASSHPLSFYQFITICVIIGGTAIGSHIKLEIGKADKTKVEAITEKVNQININQAIQNTKLDQIIEAVKKK